MSFNRVTAPPISELSTDLSLYPDVRITPSGARLHIYQNSIQPVARVEFVFKAGKWYQPRVGVASLTAKMLKEGTQTKSAKLIADTIDFYGASLEVAHGFDRASVTLYCLTRFLPALLPLAFEIIEKSSFPEMEFALMKQRVVQTLAVDKQKNSYLSTEAFTSGIYGENHPYSTLISEEDIIDLRVEELILFHKNAYSFSEAEIFITGDINATEIDNLIQRLPPEGKKLVEGPTSYALENKAGKIAERTANTMQASIRVGKSIIHPSDSNYPTLFLLNHVLGGYFGSRLMKNIREDKGFTYGISSGLSHKEHSSLFSIGTDIKGDKVEETMHEIFSEIYNLKEDIISNDELATVKKHLAGKFLSDHATLFDKMDKYKANLFLGLPADFYTQLLKNIESVSTEELQSIANIYFNESEMLQIITGGSAND